MKNKIEIGDVVIPIGETILHNGSGCYDFAIVANVKPFALASVEVDMLCTKTIKPQDALALCKSDKI